MFEKNRKFEMYPFCRDSSRRPLISQTMDIRIIQNNMLLKRAYINYIYVCIRSVWVPTITISRKVVVIGNNKVFIFPTKCMYTISLYSISGATVFGGPFTD